MMQVVTENTPFVDGTVAINNFGFGGTNVHLIMRGSTRRDVVPDDTGSGMYPYRDNTAVFCEAFCDLDINEQPSDKSFLGPDKQIIPLASRTMEGLSKLVDVLNSSPNGPWPYARELTLLASSLYSNVATHPVRGAIVPSGEATWRQAQGPNASPVWFAFSGKSFNISDCYGLAFISLSCQLLLRLLQGPLSTLSPDGG